MIATLIRTEALEDRTIGVWLFDGEHFCHTLEDTARPDGVKVKGATCIPPGLYRLSLETSPKYGPDTPTINNVPGFVGIRVHGGNTPEDTEGCPLVAFNRIGNIVQGQAKTELVKRLKVAGRSCLLVIVNHFSKIP